MTDLTPDRLIEIGGKTYTLDGSFRTLKAIQAATGKDILDVLTAALLYRLPFDDLALLVHTGIGADAPSREAIEQEIVEEIGIRKAGELVMEWLMASTSPKRDRAGNVEGLRTAVAAEKAASLKAAQNPNSRGKTTAKSA